VIHRHGWNLQFHECLSKQLQKLHAADHRARQQNPKGFESNANVRLFAALSKLIFDAVPRDPDWEEYRQGNTMGAAFRHWRRAKIGRRFRLFFGLTPRAGSSSLPGSMMKIPCDLQTVRASRTRCFSARLSGAIGPMTGQHCL